MRPPRRRSGRRRAERAHGRRVDRPIEGRRRTSATSARRGWADRARGVSPRLLGSLRGWALHRRPACCRPPTPRSTGHPTDGTSSRRRTSPTGPSTAATDTARVVRQRRRHALGPALLSAVSSPTVPGTRRRLPSAFPLAGTPMIKTTNMHQGARHTRSRPALVEPLTVGHADRTWSRPDTVRADAAAHAAGSRS